MFSKVEPARARLVDGGGQAVEIHDLIPADVYLIDRPGTRAIASWECRTNIQRGPWTLEWPDGTSEKPCAP